MLLYAITSRVLLAESEVERAEKLISLAGDWARNGIDFIQLREGDLSDEALASLASRVVQTTRATGSRTKVLINASRESALTIAHDSKADGVHLPSGFNHAQIAAKIARIRKNWSQIRGHERQNPPISTPISVSCHSVAEVQAARAAGASLALFAPVFEKVLPGAQTLSGTGLKSLAEACSVAGQSAPEPPLPVLALGGVTIENAHECLAAGASGIAAIRLFLRGILLNEDEARPKSLLRY